MSKNTKKRDIHLGKKQWSMVWGANRLGLRVHENGSVVHLRNQPEIFLTRNEERILVREWSRQHQKEDMEDAL